MLIRWHYHYEKFTKISNQYANSFLTFLLISSNILVMNNVNFLQKTPHNINELLARRIRTIRKGKKISQKRLSEKSGVSLGSIQRFEQIGEISLSSFVRIAIALELGHELEHLFKNPPITSIEDIINGQY